MTSPYVPPVIQAVGLACVPIDDMPPGTALALIPVAAAVVTLHARDDGHRDVKVDCMSDARDLEFPLPVLVEDALAPDPNPTSCWFGHPLWTLNIAPPCGRRDRRHARKDLL